MSIERRYTKGQNVVLATADGKEVGAAEVVGIWPDASNSRVELVVLRRTKIDPGLEDAFPPAWGIQQPRA